MKVIIYNPLNNETGEKFNQVVNHDIPEEIRENIHSFGELVQKLTKPKECETIIILLIGSQNQLLEISLITHLLQQHKIILILPDQEKETVFKGHQVHPKFLTFIDNGFTDVAEVLKKMMSREKQE